MDEVVTVFPCIMIQIFKVRDRDGSIDEDKFILRTKSMLHRSTLSRVARIVRRGVIITEFGPSLG